MNAIQSKALKRTFEVFIFILSLMNTVVSVYTDLIVQLVNSASKDTFLARRMDGIVGDMLSPSEELKAGKAELLRGDWLQDMIKALKTRAEERDVELPGTHTAVTSVLQFR